MKLNMGEIQTTHDLVKEILRTSPKARNSDNYLLYAVYATVGRRHGIDIDHMSVPAFFLNLKEYGFPSPETIRRARQKIQAAYPELAGNEDVEAMRELREETFKNYARGSIG